MFKMKTSGYNERQRLEILLSGLRGFRRMEIEETEGKRLINRPEWIGRRKRRIQKVLGKSTWFKKKRKVTRSEGPNQNYRKNKPEAKNEVLEREIETVMFIPYTEGSRLQKELQEEDDCFISKGKQKRIKFIERGGQTIEQLLSRSDPWSGQGCSRIECFQCQHGGGEGGSCQGEGVLYVINCLKCKEGGRDQSTGETARIVFETRNSGTGPKGKYSRDG